MKFFLLTAFGFLSVTLYSQNPENSFFGDSLNQKLDSDFFNPPSGFSFEAKEERKKQVSIKPFLDYSLSSGVDIENKTGVAHHIFGRAGLKLKTGNIRGVVSFDALQTDVGYLKTFIDSTGVVSGFGPVRNSTFGSFGGIVRGRLNWQASKHFSVEIGNNTNFWGHGYRSLVLGDNAAPYPYLKLNTKVWKINYTNLFLQLQQFGESKKLSKTRKKYMAMHAFDFKVNESFSFSVFESVVWQASDTLSNRNFEINYLNPIIFYRPVEFSQGSADNVLIGIAAQLKFEQNLMWYTQVFLDEFLLSGAKDGAGWWGNKLGVQFGLKAINPKLGLWGYSEINFARPFTYTHGSVSQNYGHLSQSLAHPLGTNFYEWSSGGQVEKEKWAFSLKFNWALYGRDKDGDNYGGDIYRSYTSPFRGNGNYIGQGNTHHSYVIQASAQRRVPKFKKVRAFAHYTWRHVKSSYYTDDQHLITVGLSSRLFKLSQRRSEGGMLNFAQDF